MQYGKRAEAGQTLKQAQQKINANNQKVALDNEYNTKLMQIDSSIKAIVVEKAKGMNYNLVLPKNIVLFGGDDITSEIAKSVK